jgi:succinyl-diaminopimelate desuccinylase
VTTTREAQVRAAVDAATGEMVALLTRLVQINSENPPGRYEAVAAAYAEALAALGMDVTTLRVPDELVTARGLATPRLNVIGRLAAATPGPSLMLNAHLDTVPIGETEAWTVDPLGGEVRDGRVWGRGAVDSKGRLAAYWTAAAAIARTGGPAAGELLVVATCDEESGGDLGARWLVEQAGLTADYAIVEGYNRPVVRASSGILWLEIEVRGRSAHASWPWRGHNAIVEAALLIERLEHLRERLESQPGDIPGIPHTTMSIGVIAGGTKVNVVPDRCRLEVDFRVMPGVGTGDIRSEVESIIARLATERPGLSAQVRVIQKQPAMVTPADSRLVRTLVDVVTEVTGEAPAVEGEPGGTDARWFNLAGIATVNYGPGSPDSGNFHAPDENVGLDQLREAATVCALTATRLLRTDRKQDVP